MRIVKQYDDDGCGLACTAMVAGTTYRKVRAKIFPDGDVAITSTAELRQIMKMFDVELAPRLVPLRGKHPRELPFDALLKVNPRQNGSEWHWVVWDHQRQRVLDPKRPAYKRYRFISYARLVRPAEQGEES